jgi:dTDP-4-dehydrorhamnose reductase
MILVTGGSGLLGSNLLLTGLHAGRPMAGVTHAHPVQLRGVQFIHLDLTDASAVRSAIVRMRPEAIIHCAAVTNLDEAERNPGQAELLNVVASSTLAAASAEVGAKFVYISTDTVFDGTRKFSRENDPINPLNVYGRTKLAGELESSRLNSESIIVRTNLYGWNAQAKESLAEWVLSNLSEGRQIRGFTDVFFCPILVNDLAEILFSMLDQALQGTFHVVGSERISKFEFAARVARQFDMDESLLIPSSVLDAELPAPRSRELSLSTERITAALGRAMPTVDEGLQRFLALRGSGYVTELRAMAISA